MNLREILIHRALSMQPKSAAGTNIQGARAEVILAQPIAVYELGTYPGGTWVAMNGLNNDGVAVGAGDVKVGGESRPIGVPIFGPKGYVWFDLGQFSSKQTDIGGSCNRISAAGMIVGCAATEPGYQHAFSWTPGPGAKKTDLGTWKQDGFDTYDTCSGANGVNKQGTLIVGWSHAHQSGTGPQGPLVGIQTPVVWAPMVVWKAGRPTTTWQIHRLDMGGLERPGKVVAGVTLNRWVAIAVNDLGQITGGAYSEPDTNGFANATPIIWSPLPGGKGWKVMPLPVSPYTNAEVWDINNLGEVVGYLVSQLPDWDAPAALWKPDQTSRKTYTLTVLPVLYRDPGWPWPFNIATGINDLGDIVGAAFNEFWNLVATRWNSKDLGFVEDLGFPGVRDWGSPDLSWASAVNEMGLVVGTYGPNNPPKLAIAVKFK